MNINNTQYLAHLMDSHVAMRPDGGSSRAVFASTSYDWKIIIYGGTMPTASAFDSGWSTLYRPHMYQGSTTKTAGSEVLVTYDEGFSKSGNTVTIASSTPSSTYHKDGTATWAAMCPNFTEQNYGNTYSSSEGSGIGNPWWSGNPISPIAMLVDVSEPSGSGIVQLVSTTVSGSAPTFYTCAYTLGV